MNRPSFFISGHSKCGTTALSRFLDQHPGLFVSKPEETNYFCPSWCRAEGPPSLFVPRTEAEYLALFDDAEANQVCGEASATYLYSPESADLIHAFDPEARIIMIFREPVDFLRSYHVQMLKNAPAEGETVRDLGKAIELEAARREGRELPDACLIPEMLLYGSDRLRYEEHYDRFAALFPPDQILAMTYDDFRGDNAGTVRRVFEFLGVDPDFEPALGDHNTGGSKVRSRRAQSLIRRATHSKGVGAKARSLMPARMRKRVVRAAYGRFALEEARPLDPELEMELRERALPHVAELGRRMERSLLDEWGYTSAPSAAPKPRRSRTA